MTTDPTPIAADSHVSGGVEVTDSDRIGAKAIMRMSSYNIWPADAERNIAWGLAEQRHRLAATPVPANAEGVKIPLVFYDASDSERRVADLAYAFERGNGRVSVQCWQSVIADLNAALTTRPTDTATREAAAREAAVEAATVERCANEGYRVCAETRHVTLGEQVRTTIRALTPAHIADAGKGKA